MGKSYKKNPIHGYTCKNSEKVDKRHLHRRSRKNLRQDLTKKVFYEEEYDLTGEDIEIENAKLIGNPWWMSKDGKNRNLMAQPKNMSDDEFDDLVTNVRRK